MDDAVVPAEEVRLLAERYVAGEIGADEYFGAVDRWARVAVEQEIREMTARRRH